jgi:flavin reductase (DIM6/NTAB) family NADH-FMN oxidoreductase RutF
MKIFEGPLVAESSSALRHVWRGFGTAVSLIATENGGIRRAMLATAVTSVALDPPSLIVCINKSASAHADLLRRGSFSLALFSAEQYSLAQHIATAESSARFDRGTWREIASDDERINDLPYLEEAQATVFCHIDKEVTFGTHSVLIATADFLLHSRGDHALLYCDGKFGKFMPV